MSVKIELFRDSDLIEDIPKQAGVYIIRSIEDEVLYIGKAKSLKDRLKSYLSPKESDAFKLSLFNEAYSVEIITTETELEAFLLESNLIKEYRPPYNIVLRDDKSYPYLRISFSEKFPRLFIARRIKHKGDFYFGPVTPVDKLRTLVKLLKSSFKVAQKNDKQCQGAIYPCIYYQMGKCSAPCVGKISQKDYLGLIEQIKRILTNPKQIKRELSEELKKYVDRLEFERAIEIRDKLKAIELLENKQTVTEIDEDFCDVVAFEKKGLIICVYIMSIRFSNITGSRDFFFYASNLDSDFAESFLAQYYIQSAQVIPDVIITEKVSDPNIMKEAFSGVKNVSILLPKRGKKRKLLDMAKKNARLSLEVYLKQFSANLKLFNRLKEVLNLSKVPYIIDVVDISHTGFENVVGGVIRYSISGFNRQMYRRYSLKEKFEKEAMFEVLSRHKKLLLKSSSRLPDLVIVDGGIIQIRAAGEALGNIDVIGISKEKVSGHSKRSLGDVEDRVYNATGEIDLDRELLAFIQKLRDEAHRFAIEYHRKKRRDYVLSSSLDRIGFIGPKRKRALFEKFGDIENLKNAPIEEIASVTGISRRMAEVIKERLSR